MGAEYGEKARASISIVRICEVPPEDAIVALTARLRESEGSLL